jgi:Putative cyclase
VPRCVNDDVLVFNTQVSLPLHSSFTLGRNSVGWIATLFLPEGEEILQWRDTGRHSCPRFHSKWHARSSSITSKLILAWARKGIVGRGVLVDYYTWALTHAPYNPLERYSIPLSNLKECIRSQNLTFRKGDILIIRSGFTINYEKLDIPAREAKASINPAHFSGVEQSEEVLEWIWENQFAAIAGDAVGFECWRINLSD